MNDLELFRKKQKFFDRWAPNYDFLLTTVFYQAIHKRLLDCIELPESAEVLDLGCGTGKLLSRLAKNYPSLQGIGLDLSAEMLDRARRNNEETRIRYLQSNAESLPFEDEQFDAVFNTISLLHYPHPERVLAEVRRVLKSGGRYYLADFSMGELLPQLLITPGSVRFYSREQREQLGEDADLRCLGHQPLLGPVLLSSFERE
ncbi:class I SAM-dependent methyltransferase [Oscillatoria sp. FACHB-1406]|uniref:class I SAM-dependent methyltransferase n=1 Tax=Oscillatoria sp. FACHB-1406 TaxID=2692846 RepID=UPI0016831C96|nr:class I SAM-dependent methyltransferase [Oscillatoria sp. FACHB-1406]MBD2576398.1 methyltransferase domain-containing protein [Oscillatoria sp. FACHB-1406]